jgi:glycosyl transferase family 87
MPTFGASGARRRSVPLVVAIVVAVVGGGLLTSMHHTARLLVPARTAINAALHAPESARVLAGAHWNRVTVTPIDDQLEHVSFLDHGQLVAEAAIDRTGGVASEKVDTMPVPYGNWVAYKPAVLAGLCVLFVLMAAVTPWWRLRNLDVIAALSFLPAVLLFQHRYLSASMLAAAPPMIYLLLRCGFVAFGPARPPRAARPLLVALTPRLDPARRVRWLRWLLAVVAVVFVMVGVGSPDAVDVLYAAMEGATRLIHGVLPYGHLPPGVIHGDTYPILTYVLYTPLALISPVNTTWDSVNGGLALAVVAALVGAAVVFRTAAGRRRRGSRRPAHVEEAGLRAALTWLSFPPLLITVSTGTTDPVLAAMLAGAILLWRRPALATGMLAVAGWFKFAPFVLLPVALAPLRGRQLVRALTAIALVSLPLLGVLFALGGVGGPADMVHSMSYQFTRGSMQSVWGALGIPGAQPFGQACVLGLIAGSALLLRREPQLAADPRRMAALCAAILIGIQLSADYWAFLYLAWVMPLIGCSVLSESGVAEPAGDPAAVGAGRLEAVGALAG